MGEHVSDALNGKSEVVVVGAGPAGCAAGIVLARAGVDVCVLDRARFPRDKPCGDAVSNDAMNLLKKLCPPGAIEQLPHAIVRRASVLFPDQTRVERVYREPGFIVPRRHLDECLRNALESSGAKLVQHRPVTSLSTCGARTNGVCGPSLCWSADIVVAAHGCNSKGSNELLEHRFPRCGCRGDPGAASVSERAVYMDLLPAPLRSRLQRIGALGHLGPTRHKAIAMTAYFRNVSFPGVGDSAEHHLSQHPGGGYGWVFPAVDAVTNVGFFAHEDALGRSGHSLRELFEEFLDSLGARFRNAERMGGPRTGWLQLAPWSVPLARDGLIVCGDAAGMADPLTGEGIWQALWSGTLAGEAALQAIRGRELAPWCRRDYERKCWRSIGRPSSARRWVHKALAAGMERRIYTSGVVQRLLEWGYRRQTFEMSKT